MKFENIAPQEIEKRSFEIVSREMGEHGFSQEVLPVVQRVIHTTADFEYIRNLYFSEDAVKKGLEALRGGAQVITDTQMAFSGINKGMVKRLGGEVHCFMSDEDVAQKARDRGVTRAAVSMEKAAEIDGPLIFAIGNAPTALIRLRELAQEQAIDPKLIIGVPVGFVNVVESKELWVGQKETPCIIARGRKGGSNVAAAIVNALLYQMVLREGFR